MKKKIKLSNNKMCIINLFKISKYAICLFMLGWHRDVFAQISRNNFSFNIGVNLSNTLSSPYYTYLYDEGGVVVQQRVAIFSDFNIIYKQPIKQSNISSAIGFGLSHKGYREIGQAYEGAPGNAGHYSHKIWEEYIPIFLGVHYNLKSKKYIQLSVNQLFLYEYNTFWINSNLKKYAYSTRTNLTATYTLKNKRKLLITSYFQTALVKYNKEKNYPWSRDYWPYCYGLNLGISLKNKKKNQLILQGK